MAKCQICLYINGLCYKPCIYNPGCNSSGEMINNIVYIDDLSLLSPSPKGLQKFIDISEEYGKNTTSYVILKRLCACILKKALKIDSNL